MCANPTQRVLPHSLICICNVVLSTGNLYKKICTPKCVGGITWTKHAHAQSQFVVFEQTCDTRIIHLNYKLEKL